MIRAVLLHRQTAASILLIQRKPAHSLCLCALLVILNVYFIRLLHGTVAQWLRYCATNRKVAGSIPAGVIGIFH